MDIDDLKQRWDDQDRKLDTLIRLNTRLLQEPVLNRAATAMTRLSWLMLPEMILNLLVCGWLGSFIADHLHQVRFVIPAVALDLGALALLIAGIRQWATIWSIDYSAPIVEIQKRLGSLKVQRVRVTKLVFLTAPLVWTPMLIVGLKGFLHLDAYRIFSLSWLAANLAVGVAVIPLAVWIARRTADRMERSPLGRNLLGGFLRDIAGYNLNAALGFVGTLAEFEKE
jgi:hypothetical protein